MDKLGKTTSPQVLANNLKRLMEGSSSLHTQAQVAEAAKIAQTAVSLMLRPGARLQTKSGTTPSPKLSEVEAVARAFKMEVWQLLVDPGTLSETVTRALSSPAVTETGRLPRELGKVRW